MEAEVLPEALPILAGRAVLTLVEVAKRLKSAYHKRLSARVTPN